MADDIINEMEQLLQVEEEDSEDDSLIQQLKDDVRFVPSSDNSSSEQDISTDSEQEGNGDSDGETVAFYSNTHNNGTNWKTVRGQRTRKTLSHFNRRHYSVLRGSQNDQKSSDRYGRSEVSRHSHHFIKSMRTSRVP